MSHYHIRKYKDCDYQAVRSMFAYGILEHLPASRRFLLKCPQIHLFLLSVFLALFIVFRSYLLSVTAFVVLLAAGLLLLNFEFQSYIQQCLREDLLDIQKSYMQREDSCFWVAKSGGEIVGMVAAQPPQQPDGEVNVMELRRMSVGKNCRGQGIGKALCSIVIGFAQDQGCRAVILNTSIVQHAAHKLYESVGFHKYEQTFPSFLWRVINFGILRYRFDIPVSNSNGAGEYCNQ